MWTCLVVALALAADPAPAPAEPAPAAEPVPTVKPPVWWTTGCESAVTVPADGKLADPTGGECTWDGKPKFIRPKDEARPASPCEAWFKSVSGMITGKIAVDDVCPEAHEHAVKNFILEHSWNAAAVHLTVTFAE